MPNRNAKTAPQTIAFLRWYMEKGNISQSRLAAQLNTSQPILSRWLRRKAISDLWCFAIRVKLAEHFAKFEDEVLSQPKAS